MTDRPFLTRVILKTIRIFVVTALYCWIGYAIYLWASSSFYPQHGPWARVYLSMRDSLHTLPDTFLYLLGGIAELVGWAHDTLIIELGYDPVVLPDFGKPSIGSFPSIGSTASIEFSSIGSYMAYGAVFALTVMTAVQFLILFTASAALVGMGWRYPGIPVIFSIGARLLYFASALLAALWVSYLSLGASTLSGVVAALSSLLLLRWPLTAGLPLWLLDVTGLRPRTLVSLPFSILRSLFVGLSSNQTDKTSGRAHTRQSNQDTQHSTDRRTEEQSSRANVQPPAGQDTDERLKAACATFGVDPESMTQKALVSRFRELVRKIHPDAQGSERLTSILNQDYEFLLQYKGWKR